MKPTTEPQRRPGPPKIWKTLAGLAALGVIVAGLLGARLYRDGYHFRHLKPNEWYLRARGLYRFDPARFVVRQGAPDRPVVALTFDDGPSAITPAILNALKENDARATFFLVGSNVKKRPELARRMAAEGHDLANHSRSHLRLPPLRGDQIRNEIANGTTVIARATGERVRLFRPPGGQYDGRVLDEAARQGLMTVLWSTNTGDWRERTQQWIENRVLSDVQSGDIVLMHESHPETAAALPEIVRGLRARGYRLVTVSELLEESGYPLPPVPAPRAASAR